MENNKWSFFTILLVIFLSLSVFLLTFCKGTNSDPTVVYTVYLDGKAIGTIASEDSFNEFVNTKEDELKKKYNVDTVYTPRGVEIKKNLTYNNFINSDEQVYNKIISSKNFSFNTFLLKCF